MTRPNALLSLTRDSHVGEDQVIRQISCALTSSRFSTLTCTRWAFGSVHSSDGSQRSSELQIGRGKNNFKIYFGEMRVFVGLQDVCSTSFEDFFLQTESNIRFPFPQLLSFSGTVRKMERRNKILSSPPRRKRRHTGNFFRKCSLASSPSSAYQQMPGEATHCGNKYQKKKVEGKKGKEKEEIFAVAGFECRAKVRLLFLLSFPQETFNKWISIDPRPERREGETG